MITGIITKILTQKENDWGRYELVLPDKRKLIAVGIIKEAAVGTSVVLEGNEEDTKYGHQFSIVNVLSTEADELAGIRHFLLDGYLKGIGSVKAESIISSYGKDSLDLLDSPEGHSLLLSVKGISNAVLETMLESYQESKKYKDIVVFLNGQGTKNQIEKIYEKYGDDAIKILKSNPYKLQTDLDGFGFKKTDKMAISSGIKPDSIYRVMAAVKYILEEASNTQGHCYLEISEIKKELLPLLAPCPKLNIEVGDIALENALNDWENKREKFCEKNNLNPDQREELEVLVQTRRLILEVLNNAIQQAIEEEVLVDINNKIYTKKMYQTERETAELIASMLSERPVRTISDDLLKRSIVDVEKRKTEELQKEGKNVIRRFIP